MTPELLNPRQRTGARSRSTLGLVLLLVAFVAPAEAAKKPRHVPPGELTNPLLGPSHAQWLVGPISWLVTPAERDAYLFLATDEEAEAFIDDWWQSHSEIREQFERRRKEADDEFGESTTPGSRTDRGIVWVIHGPPEKTERLEHRNVLEPTIERWSYPKSAPKGLDGEKPARAYDFAKENGKTTFYADDPAAMRRREFEQRMRPPGR